MSFYDPSKHLAPDVQAARDIEWGILFQDICDKFINSILTSNKLPDDWDEIRLKNYLPQIAIDGKTTVYISCANLVGAFYNLINNEKQTFKLERTNDRVVVLKRIACRYGLKYLNTSVSWGDDWNRNIDTGL